MSIHKPVLLNEAVAYLNVRPGEIYIDATYGGGGHSREIIKRGGKVLALDVSPRAVAGADQDPNLKVRMGNFSKIAEIAKDEGVSQVAGVLFDLGISSDELEEIPGLSFQRAEDPLDMRLDPALGVTAADLVNALPESKLVELFSSLGEESHSKSVARGIVRVRQEKQIKKVGELLEVVDLVKGRHPSRIHPATQIFQALRMAVNSELDNLSGALPGAASLLSKGGRLVVISFHSGEDRIVKNYFKRPGLKILTESPIVPTESEIEVNSRARSAKLRAAERE